MSRTLDVVPAALVAALIAAAPAAALAVDSQWNVKLKAAGYDEEAMAPDSGTAGGSTTAPEDTTSKAGYLDLQPQLYTRFSPDWAHFVRAQGFLPSDTVQASSTEMANQQGTTTTSGFAALREFWIEYGGITSYPGEVLRLGLQRLRDPDGLWWDHDIESARWIFDTTLFQFQIGGAKAYNTWRTDTDQLPSSLNDRAYGFVGWGTQWVPDNYVGVRIAYAADQKELPPDGSQMTLNSTSTDPQTGATVNNWDQPQKRNVGWVGLSLDNHYYDWERGPGLAYRLEAIAYGGTEDTVQPDPSSGVVVGTTTEDVRAVGGEGLLRARFPDPFPLQLGGGYAYGQGGHDDNGDHDFRQTGLQSNRSRFTGTRTIMNRFNEALQANLTNLRVVTAFLSLPLTNWDFSVVGNKFQRDDPTRRVYTDGVLMQPDRTNGSHDLGTGWDVVLTRQLSGAVRGYSLEDDRRSNIRVRASQFKPGDAYGGQLKNQTLVALEATLWF